MRRYCEDDQHPNGYHAHSSGDRDRHDGTVMIMMMRKQMNAIGTMVMMPRWL